jgi:hypothetical protein
MIGKTISRYKILKLQKAILDAPGSRDRTLKPPYRFNLKFCDTQKGSSHVPWLFTVCEPGFWG